MIRYIKYRTKLYIARMTIFAGEEEEGKCTKTLKTSLAPDCKIITQRLSPVKPTNPPLSYSTMLSPNF